MEPTNSEEPNIKNSPRRRSTARTSSSSTKRKKPPMPTSPEIREDDENFIPEKISIDFDDAEESDRRSRRNGYSEETWTPKSSVPILGDDLPTSEFQPNDGEIESNPEFVDTETRHKFSTEMDSSEGDGQSSNFRPGQKGQYDQNQRLRKSSNFSDNRGRRENNRSFQNNPSNPQGSNQQNRRGQNQSGHQNRQKFARTVRIGQLSSGLIKGLDCLSSFEKLEDFANENIDLSKPVFDFNAAYENRTSSASRDIIEDISSIDGPEISNHKIFELILNKKFSEKIPILANGVLETIEGGDGLLVYANDNYRIRPQSAFIPKFLITKFGLRRGQDIAAYIHPPAQNSTCPFVLKLYNVMGREPEKVPNFPKFKDLIPFYPTERLFLECTDDVKWDNVSMRIIDILTPIGLGQRGLIVAPPRTGKTVLLQGIANAISKNRPDVKLIILLIDERPEEVTDFKRQVVNAEIISSTFDESTDNHVHAADMVIDKSRRQVEAGNHVVILLDSITRLARAHNTEQPSSGKLLSGGVDANALQAPKRFFGAARNIEGGGSLTILATALVETGSRMDEVIFEEFKGTGNMELHLDRGLVDKRMFPALNMEKSGTRKEELLYHPDEMEKVYALRRAMKGISSIDAMEMLIQRIRKTRNNTEFLLNINR